MCHSVTFTSTLDKVRESKEIVWISRIPSSERKLPKLLKSMARSSWTLHLRISLRTLRASYAHNTRTEIGSRERWMDQKILCRRSVSNDKRRRQLNRSIDLAISPGPSTVCVCFSPLSYRRSVDNAGSRVACRRFTNPPCGNSDFSTSRNVAQLPSTRAC